MQNIKPPGVLWVVLIVVAVALAHRYLDDPFLVEVIVVVAGMILKSLKLGTDQLEEAIEIINIFKLYRVRPVVTATGVQMRGTPQPGEMEAERSAVDNDLAAALEPPPMPNKMMTWLVG